MRCLFCGMEKSSDTPNIPACGCLGFRRIIMNEFELKERLTALEGDTYILNQEIVMLKEKFQRLDSQYEKLLNRVKCTECNLNNKKD